MSLFTIQSDFRYEITEVIYEGTMGIVFAAEQHGAKDFMKQVAIKVIRPSYAGQAEFIENFVGEAKLVADLIHTNIMQTYHLGESTRLLYARLGNTGAAALERYRLYQGLQVYYIAMELIRGTNLEEFQKQLVFKNTQLPPNLAVFIVSRVARGLAYAHAKRAPDGTLLGIVHRDIAPKNIMISLEGDVKIIDFGIAKAKGFLVDNEGIYVSGKPEYMSPEQSDFKPTDRRSDIYSAAVVLTELLLGRNLFKSNTPADTREKVMNMPLPNFRELNPAIDDSINQILQRALARDPAMRYPTAKDFLHDLEYHIYHKGYGPTNETLGEFIRNLFDMPAPEDNEPITNTIYKA